MFATVPSELIRGTGNGDHGDLPFIQTTSHHAAMWEHQSDDLAECERERPVLRNDLLSTIQGSVRHLAQQHLVLVNRAELGLSRIAVIGTHGTNGYHERRYQRE